jgi:hypothetical protein
MLRGNSVFVDGGVQLFRNAETTWLGFSEPSCSLVPIAFTDFFKKANTSLKLI